MKKFLLSIAAVAAAACGSYSAAADATIDDTYKVVASDADLELDGEYILCYETNAMGALSGKYHLRVANGVTITDDVATIASTDVQSFKLVAGTTGGTYAFQFAEGNFFSCTASKNNNLASATELAENCNLSISITDGVATIIPTANSNSNKCKIQYNSNTNQERFSNYNTGTQKDCTLYKKVTGGDPVDPVAPGYKWMLGEQEVEEATVTIGANDNLFPTLYNPNNVSVAYSIEADTEVASIDPATGEITLLNEGVAIVYAKSEATAKYLAGEEMYMLTVNPKAPETKCATPTFSIPSGSVVAGTEVTVSCETEGAILMLFVNEEPIESESNTYVVTINEETTISAWAEKERLEDSEITEATYTIKEIGDDPVEGTATFYAPGATEETDVVFITNGAAGDLDGESFKSGKVTITFDANSQSSSSKIWNDTEGLVRWYKNNKIVVTPDEYTAISEISLYVPSTSYHKTFTVYVGDSEIGTDVSSYTDNAGIWTTTESITSPVTLQATSAQIRFSYMTVKYKEATSGIKNVTATDENAPVEYYNLQGIRVNNPEGGVYIRRQGSTATKVLVK